MSDDDVELIRRLHEAWVAGDREAALAGVDPDRVTAWLFARLVVEAAWWPYDVAALARTLRP